MATWTGQASIKGRSEPIRMFLLTFVMIGIVFTWGIEMTYCTPYLLSLGLTKSKTSLVWIAGPLSGLIVQPIVGAISDESTSPWGRRRPIIMICSLIVAVGLLVLGFTSEIIAYLIPDEQAAKTPTIFLAVFSIYAIDFAINAVMSCSRSLIVDTLGIEKQQSGAAWASRVGALGHLIGYGMGAVDMVALFGPTLGDTQFKQLAVVAAGSMLTTASVTCWAVTERVLVSTKHNPNLPDTRFKFVHQIWSTLLHLPPRIRAICWAQFWSWIGWFPLNFYSSTWVGETYFRYDMPQDKGGQDTLGDIGRIGSSTLVIYSCVTFTGALFLPMLIKAPDEEGFTMRPPESMKGFLLKVNEWKPDLLTAWIAGHLIFACTMFFAPLATSYRFATLLVAICGLPWALASWAPVTFLGVEVNKMAGAPGPSAGGASYRHVTSQPIEMEVAGRADDPEHTAMQGPTGAVQSSGELSGIYFGILNIFTTLPQFVGTFISSIVFSILEPGKSPELAHNSHPNEHHRTDGPNAIAVCLFIGACSALIAARATMRLRNI